MQIFFVRRLFLLGIVLFISGYTTFAQPIPVNYDEEKAGNYKLPDLLQFLNGKKVITTQQWIKQRRPEILNLFKQEVYGQFPGKPKQMHYRVNETDSTALNGLATRKQVTIFFSKVPDAPHMEVLLYLPNKIKKPVPAFVGLNFYGNQCVHPDPGIKLPDQWLMQNDAKGVVDHKATEATRGMQASRWLVEELMQQGFALVTAYYGDLEPDHPDGWKTGIRSTLQTELGVRPEEWGAISAWAWGLSRVMDYLQTEPAINANKVALTGHSRLGKAALWAGANDQRFALVIANDSGEGGAALARRNYGETIEHLNKSFPHWFNLAYRQYNQNPQKLPVDQHMLLALIAPRPLYVNSAVDDQWADPKGEFLGALQAEPIYRLYQKAGLGVSQMPPVEKPAGNFIRYHIRTGKHDITAYDWQQHLAFAQRHFGYAPR